MNQRSKQGKRGGARKKGSNGQGVDYFNTQLLNSYKKFNNGDGEKKKKRKRSSNSEESEHKKRKTVSVRKDVVKFLRPRPTLRYCQLGGIEKVVDQLNALVHRPFEFPQVYTELGVTPIRGILLHGPPGCGKTSVCHALAGELGEHDVSFFSVSGPELTRSNVGESEEKLRGLFELATAKAPSLILLDEVDAMVPKRDNSKGVEKRLVSQLCTCLDKLSLDGVFNVCIVACTNRPEIIDSALRRAGRFDKELTFGMPDEEARFRILEVIAKGKKISDEVDLKYLARMTPGYVGADLQALMQEACTCAITRVFDDLGEGQLDVKKLFIQKVDFAIALPKVQPSSKREGFTTVPDVTWEDVGALEDVRGVLVNSILRQISHSELYSHVGLKEPAGIILFGPPGCGKTLLAKAVANDCRANFISVKGPELLNKYVGETERAVRIVFQRASTSSPCVVFFDELDALCPRRSSGSVNKVTDRVVNQLLTEMEGLQSRKDVHVIAATNRIDIIDPAILRPGRLGKVVYVPLPSQEARVKILRTLIRKSPVEQGVDLEKICSQCQNFSGADLKFLVKEASLVCLTEALEKNLTKENVVIKSQHFNSALKNVRPSVTEDDRKYYELLAMKYFEMRIR